MLLNSEGNIHNFIKNIFGLIIQFRNNKTSNNNKKNDIYVNVL